MRASALLCLLISAALAAQSSPAPRTMAITIDDLPYMHARAGEPMLPHARRATNGILGALRAHGAIAVGFVTEYRLAGDQQRIALLKQWVDARMILGNHTYSHPDLNRLTADEFAGEIAKGDVVTRRLMQPRQPYQMFFRHPMNHTGDTKEKKEAVERYLAARGYAVAPHTVENNDFLFDPAYARARQRGDAALARRIMDAYLDHTIEMTAFAEQKSVEVFGRDVPQTLLIHANELNADGLGEMLRRLKGRGYRFIPLDQAMKDAAYRTRDTVVSRTGPTYLFRWARSLNRNVSFDAEPRMPAIPGPSQR